MAFLDARAPITFEWVNSLLLDAAQHPKHYSELIYAQVKVGPETDPRSHPSNPAFFVELSRQSCAAIVVNCAAELWSELAHCLLVLEPSNPITEDVKQFLREERLGNLRFFEHYFKLCGKTFRGTKTYDDTKLIYDLRDAIMHDRPDHANAQIEEDMEKWIRRLRARLSEEDLSWLPEIPTLYRSGMPVPSNCRVPVMNFMRYPLAKWVSETTRALSSEMSEMMFAFGGAKRVAPCIEGKAVPRSIEAAAILDRLRVGGISTQIVIGNSADTEEGDKKTTATD